MWLKGHVTVMIEAPQGKSITAKYGGHRHCGSGDIGLACRMILHDHKTKRSSNFMGESAQCKSPSCQV